MKNTVPIYCYYSYLLKFHEIIPVYCYDSYEEKIGRGGVIN